MSGTKRRTPITRLAIATATVALLAACSSDDKSDSDATAETEATSSEEPPQTAAPTATAATSASIATTTTTTSTTTTTTTSTTTTTEPPPQPTKGVVGLVWASAVSDDRVNTDTPQPTYDVDGISSRIENVLLVESGSANDIQSECAEEARFLQDFEGGELATQCLIVQWAFDVAEDFSTDEFSQDGDLVPGAIVTPEGRQLDQAIITSGFPGTIDNRIVAVYAGASPGSTLRFDTGSNFVGYTTHVFEIPPAEAFMPVFFD